MNADLLLTHYERIGDAPGANARLRRFILELAVVGKLAPQDRNDEPAGQVLKRIAAERKHRRRFAQLEVGELKKPLPTIPTTWTWTVADQVAADDENAITDGPFGAQLKTAHYVGSPGYRVVRLQNIGSGFFRDEHRSYIDKARFDRLAKHHVVAGDLVVAGLVDPSVRCCQLPADIGPALVKADCYRFSVHPLIAPRFALYYLNSPIAQDFAAEHHHGMTLTRIGLGNFRNIPFPLPPLAEQHRIVAKVDELMAFCDRLNGARAAREEMRDRLAAATLARLKAPDHATFNADAQFALDVLPSLTTRPDQIERLGQTILNLAVLGRLVPQEANDEPASELLNQIARKRAQLVKTGEIRKIGPVTDLTGTNHGLTVPHGWVVTNLQSLCTSITDGDHLPPPKAATGIPFLVIGDVRHKHVNFTASRFVPPDYYWALDPIRRPKPGDLLYTLVGSYGIPIVIRDDRPFCVQRHIGILRVCNEVDVNFLARVLESRMAFEQATACATGIAQKTVPLSGLRRLLVLLPPLAEQRRIVARVDELMALCDGLEARLDSASDIRHRLLDALLTEALTPAATVAG